MAMLSARFREVEVTLDQPGALAAALPERWPDHWLRPETAPSMIRFITDASIVQRIVRSDSIGPQSADNKAMADKNTIKDLLTDEIKDLYSAEKQLTKAIPKMAKGSDHPALKDAFSGHLKETLAQVTRLEKAGELLGIKVTGKKCVGMEGCIEEGAEALEEDGEESILDLGLIGAGSRVEHYEMAGYLTAISLAKRMGAADVVNLLQQSLAEEQNAEKKLRSIASGLIKSAATEKAQAA
jgi:ferritin-like metal-binding protein YciE